MAALNGLTLPSGKLVCVNVGCGNRPFKSEGSERWINIDIAENTTPDIEFIKADVREIPIEDNQVDVFFSCHVIEHFWPWEIANVLREWKRVIKPGGIIVTECPNVINSLSLLMIGMNAQNNDFIEMAMNGLYGDPKDRELPLRHKWGYTPKSLCDMKELVGFVSAEHVRAQFKQYKTRDMRIIAKKP